MKEIIIEILAAIGIATIAFIVGVSAMFAIDEWKEKHAKYCPKCGRSPDKWWWDYCPNCGAELKERNK